MTAPAPAQDGRPGRSSALLLTARTLAVGTLGGWVAYVAGVPLGWMLGALALTTGLAIGGVRMTTLPQPRRAMIAVIGLMVGSAFTPEVLAQAARWSLSLGAVAAYTVASGAFGIWFCHRIGRLDAATSALGGVPGGLSEMIIMAPSLGADVRSISMIHATRLVFLVTLVPLGLTASGALAEIGAGTINRTVHWAVELSIRDAAVLLAAAVLGPALARRLRIPTPDLTGPLILSALVHITGLTQAQVPGLLIAMAQMVIGATVGQHFAGVRRQVLIGGVLLGLALTTFYIAVAILLALALAWAIEVPFAIGMLALVPGGLPEMSLVAISLDADPAFVSVHHLCRVVLIVTLVPLLVPSLQRWASGEGAHGRKRLEAAE